MIVLIFGASHTGKTLLAQNLLEKYKYPYLSIDHLKMGFIRSGYTDLTPCDDEAMTKLLWPVVLGIIKTAVENSQNLIIEGCYIPFDFAKDLDAKYLEHIKAYCLMMTEEYLRSHFCDVLRHACAVEKRICDDCDLEELIAENNINRKMCEKYGINCVLIDKVYKADIEL